MKQGRPGKFVSSSKTAAVVNKFYCNAKSFQCTGEGSSLSCKWFWPFKIANACTNSMVGQDKKPI